MDLNHYYYLAFIYYIFLLFLNSSNPDSLIYIVHKDVVCRRHNYSVRGVMVSAAVDGGKLIGYFNLPWFAWGSAEMHLGDSVEYNTLVRVASPYDRLATAIIKLFVYYNVRRSIGLGRIFSVSWNFFHLRR